MNGYTIYSYLRLCLENQQLINSKLMRRPEGSDLDWLDELAD